MRKSNSGELSKQKWNVKGIRELTVNVQKMDRTKGRQGEPRPSQAVGSDGVRGWTPLSGPCSQRFGE